MKLLNLMNRIENEESRENSDQEEEEEEKEEGRFRTCDGSHELLKENEIDHQLMKLLIT